MVDARSTAGEMIDIERLREDLWRGARSRLREPVEELAKRRGEAVYVVGGLPRAIALGGDTRDIDLVVEGDGIGFARALGSRLGASVKSSERFLTAELDIEGVGRLDVSTARRETYPAPGALPEVEPAGIGEDLERRDFTVNTLAVGVGAGGTEPVLSHPASLADLAGRVVRVLHDRSFLDDPTRLLRAVDLEIAIDGRMDVGTEALARRALSDGALETVTGERLWAVMTVSLSDAARIPRLLERWERLGIAERLLGDLGWDEEGVMRVSAALDLLARLARAADGGAGDASSVPGIETTLLAISTEAPEAGRRRWTERFSPPRALRKLLLDEESRWRTASRALGEPRSSPSTDHGALGGLRLSELAVVGSRSGPDGAERVLRELTVSRKVELLIGAEDLIERGAEPGPLLRRALERTLAARIDGLIEADEELDFAMRRLAGDG